MNKRILFFVGGAYVSGMETVALHLMRGLKENGYDIRCVTSGWNDGNFKKKLEDLQVPCYAIKLGWIYLRKPLWTIDTLVHFPGAYFQLKKIIKDFDPSVCTFCNVMPVLYSGLIKQKSVFNLQETHLPGLKNKLLYKKLNKKMNAFVAVSNHIVKVLQNLSVPDDKIKLIYNGIPPVKVAGPASSLINGPVLTFAIVGQVGEWKGHRSLVAAVYLLANEGIKNFVVDIYGNDKNEFGATLKQLIIEKGLTAYFNWKGFVTDQAAIYNNSAVIIVPSLSGEPCSLSIIEAMNFCKGLIVSDRGGNPELVDHGINGLVFKADVPIALSNCMKQFIRQPELITQLGENAGRKSATNYNYTTMTKKYIEIYESL